jgi:hypothetical protein
MNKIINFIKNRQWWIIFITGIFSFLIGSIGFLIDSNFKISFLNSFYLSAQLFIFQVDFTNRNLNGLIEIARWTAPFTLAFATVRTILIIVREEIEELKLKSFNEHVIICGLGHKGFRLAKDLFKANAKVIIIETNSNNEYINICKEKGMKVIIGNATHNFILNKANVKNAHALFAVADKDDINIAIAIKAFEIKNNISDHIMNSELKQNNSVPDIKQDQDQSKLLRCYVHIGNLKLQSLFKQHYLFKIHDDKFEAIIFNIFDICARETIYDFVMKNYIHTIHHENNPLHILIVGFGSMGESLMIEAAKMCHFSNGKKVIITVLDKRAKSKEDKFKLEFLYHKQLKDLIDIKFEKYDAKNIKENELLELQKISPFNIIYICSGNEASRIFVSLNLRNLLSQIPIRIFMPEKSGFTPLFETGQIFSETQNIEIYNMVDSAYKIKKIVRSKLEELAQIIHEDFIQRERNKFPERFESGIPDNSLKNWANLPEEDKELNISAVLQIPLKLGAIGYNIRSIIQKENFNFTDEEITTLAKIGHKQWMAERLLSGWIFGEQKTSLKKIHPDLRSWSELTAESREKQKDFIRLIPKLLKNCEHEYLDEIFGINPT